MIKNIIGILCKRFYPEKKVRTPKSLGAVTIGEVSKILNPLCKNVFLSDTTYLTTSMEEAKRYTKESLIDGRKYVKDVHDCDNFSFALNGYWSDSLVSYCFGIAWSKEHAFNLMVDYKKQIWVVEPQSNKWFRLEEIKKDKKYFPFRLILI